MKDRGGWARPRRPQQWFSRRLGMPGFWALLAIVVLLVAYGAVIVFAQPHPDGRRVDFSTFVTLADGGRIQRATVLDQDSYVQGTLRRAGGRLETFNTPYLKSETTRGMLV